MMGLLSHPYPARRCCRVHQVAINEHQCPCRSEGFGKVIGTEKREKKGKIVLLKNAKSKKKDRIFMVHFEENITLIKNMWVTNNLYLSMVVKVI